MMTNTNLTDRQKVAKAFRRLRRAGIVARMNYACCQSCGWAQIDKDYTVNDIDTAVFFHNQDNDAFDKAGDLNYSLWLAWTGDGDRIVAALRNEGLTVSWTGYGDDRIAVLPTNKQEAK